MRDVDRQPCAVSILSSVSAATMEHRKQLAQPSAKLDKCFQSRRNCTFQQEKKVRSDNIQSLDCCTSASGYVDIPTISYFGIFANFPIVSIVSNANILAKTSSDPSPNSSVFSRGLQDHGLA